MRVSCRSSGGHGAALCCSCFLLLILLSRYCSLYCSLSVLWLCPCCCLLVLRRLPPSRSRVSCYWCSVCVSMWQVGLLHLWSSGTAVLVVVFSCAAVLSWMLLSLSSADFLPWVSLASSPIPTLQFYFFWSEIGMGLACRRLGWVCMNDVMNDLDEHQKWSCIGKIGYRTWAGHEQQHQRYPYDIFFEFFSRLKRYRRR